MPITDEKLQKFERLMAHAVEQAQKIQFLNALHTLGEANLMLVQALSAVLKNELVGWGRGTTRPISTDAPARPPARDGG